MENAKTSSSESSNNSEWLAAMQNYGGEKPEDINSESSELDFSAVVAEATDADFKDTIKRSELIGVLKKLPQSERLSAIRGTKMDSYTAFMSDDVIPALNLNTCTPEEYWDTIDVMRNPEAWSEDRAELHGEIVSTTMEKMKSMSARLRAAEIERGEPKPIIYLMRGCCGAGKTTALRSSEGRIPGVLDEKGEPTGTLAPDTYKPALRRGSMDSGADLVLSHSQVHQESGFVGVLINDEIKSVSREAQASGEGFSMVVDKLMASTNAVTEMFKEAAETDRNVNMIDVDVPLELSAIRVLGRTAEGDDPQMNFHSVAGAFTGIRTKRKELLDDANAGEESHLHNYELVIFDPDTHEQRSIFQTRDGVEVKGGDGQASLDEAMKFCMTTEQAAEEVERTRTTVINEEFVARFMATYFKYEPGVKNPYAERTLALLNEYYGMTIEDAMAVRCGEKSREEVEIHTESQAA